VIDQVEAERKDLDDVLKIVEGKKSEKRRKKILREIEEKEKKQEFDQFFMGK
jgi:hypothetical protein